PPEPMMTPYAVFLQSNYIKQEKLDCCRQHALVRQDQSPHVKALRWEGAVGSVRADPDASCQRNEAARGNHLLLRSWLRRLMAPPPARSTRHPQLRDRPWKSAGCSSGTSA